MLGKQEPSSSLLDMINEPETTPAIEDVSFKFVNSLFRRLEF
jgi:hypothetical protein